MKKKYLEVLEKYLHNRKTFNGKTLRILYNDGSEPDIYNYNWEEYNAEIEKLKLQKPSLPSQTTT